METTRMITDDVHNSEAQQRALGEAKEIVEGATFPERVQTETLTSALFATVPTEELVRRLLESGDDMRVDNHLEFIAASRALLRRAGIDDTVL